MQPPSARTGVAACTRLLESKRWSQADRAAIYSNRGIAHAHLRQYQRAIADFDQAIRLNPRHREAYNNRGVIYDSLKQFRRAKADYDQAIRLNPRDARAYNNRGVSFGRLGQYRRAIADFDQAVRLNPRNAAAYYNRGRAYLYGLKNRVQAVADFRAAYRLGFNRAAEELHSLGIKP